MFPCRMCHRTCNERIGPPLNHLQAPIDSAVLVVGGGATFIGLGRFSPGQRRLPHLYDLKPDASAQ